MIRLSGMLDIWHLPYLNNYGVNVCLLDSACAIMTSQVKEKYDEKAPHYYC